MNIEQIKTYAPEALTKEENETFRSLRSCVVR